MTAASRLQSDRWKSRLAACLLGAAALTAFLMHLGAADPWLGGVAVPAMVWIAWMAIDMARASRRRIKQRRDSLHAAGEDSN